MLFAPGMRHARSALAPSCGSFTLTPYWSDQDQVCASLDRLFPRHAVEHARYVGGPDEPVVYGEQGAVLPYRLPPPGTLVLVLGDLGCLDRRSDGASRYWQTLGQQLLERGCRTVALAPCQPGRWLAGLPRRHWTVMSWERALGGTAADDEAVAARAERLLRLVSPAVRIEPGLLRAVRLLLQPHEADAATESAAWQHPAVASRHSVAATLDAEAAKRLRQAFAEEPPELRRQVLALLRQWRAGLPQEIWLDEIYFLDPGSQALLPEARDLEEARQFFQWIGQRVQGFGGEAPDGALTWARRVLGRVSEGAWRDPEKRIPLSRLAAVSHATDADWVPKAGFEPAAIPAADTRRRRLELRQRGGVLSAAPAPAPTHGTAADSPSSLLGAVHTRNGLIHVLAETFWARGTPPPWAREWGIDEHGPWLELVVHGPKGGAVRQRLRWIPAGEFLMGSSEDEPERFDDEGPQHLVQISRGFWLFDTACTQALWEAVMGENPSHFRGPERPVENISWNDVQGFLERLNAVTPGLDLTLPSEAQWEYAARGRGHQWSFPWGNEYPECCSASFSRLKGSPFELLGVCDGYGPEPVGSHGRTSSCDGPADETPLGVLDLGGNVREFTRDAFRGLDEDCWDSPGVLEQPVCDEPGAFRIGRGGDWSAGAGVAHSSLRHPILRDSKGHTEGFRCVYPDGKP